MQPNRRALNGLLALCVALFLTSCATNGPEPVVQYQLQEVPVPVAVTIPRNLTEEPALPPLPTPAYRDTKACRAGCYTNEQLRDLLDSALAWGSQAVENLRAIRVYSDTEAARINAARKEGKP